MGETEWPWTWNPNARPAVRECARCGGEIYGGDAELCAECEAQIQSLDTVVQYAEAWPRRLFKFLWSEKDEDYMKEFFGAFQKYCEGNEAGCPDIDEWARS